MSSFPLCSHLFGLLNHSLDTKVATMSADMYLPGYTDIQQCHDIELFVTI